MNKNYTYPIIGTALILILGGAYYAMSQPKTATTPIPEAPAINYPKPELEPNTQANTEPTAQTPAKPAANYPKPELKPSMQTNIKPIIQPPATQKPAPELPSTP